MPKPRNRQISLQDTPYCISRCVRRAFLCGIDPLTGFDFSHRRGWIAARVKKLASIFAIDICAYAVMNNHVVIRIFPETAREWSGREVAERWLQLFNGSWLVRSWMAEDTLDAASLRAVSSLLETWRTRLSDISWFMRCMNKSIARMANREDCCTGRFWEGRFKSQALLDEKALLACMAYVDLNPIRAAIARTPEHSYYTSIRDRIRYPDSHGLYPFIGREEDEKGLPFTLEGYLELVDWSGRIVRSDKRGAIPKTTPPILYRLDMQPEALVKYLTKKPERLSSAMGPITRMQAKARNLGAKFLHGGGLSRVLFQN